MRIRSIRPEFWTSSAISSLALDGWLDLGITIDQIITAHGIALSKRHVRSGDVFRYMAGIIKNWVIELDEATRGILAGEG